MLIRAVWIFETPVFHCRVLFHDFVALPAAHAIFAVKEGKRVDIVGAAQCYLHLAGVSGFPHFIARMQPSYIMRSEDAFDDIPLAVGASHWLSTPAGDDKLPWETMPYFLVGASAWDTDVTSFPQPSMERYGRVGAPGSAWWVAVHEKGRTGAGP